MTLCVRSKQPRTIKTIIYNNTFTSIRRKKVQSRVKQFKKLFSPVCYFFALNKPSSALNYLKKNCIYLNQSELSNFFMYLSYEFWITRKWMKWVKSPLNIAFISSHSLHFMPKFTNIYFFTWLCKSPAKLNVIYSASSLEIHLCCEGELLTKQRQRIDQIRPLLPVEIDFIIYIT